MFGRPYSLDRLIRETFELDASRVGFGMLALAAVAWPWASLAALMVFQASMRRAKVRWVHVARCVLYSADLVLWLSPPVIAGVAVFWLYGAAPFGYLLPLISVALPVAAWGVFAYRLTTAYQRYLKFDRPAVTVLCSQLIVVLAYAKLDMMAKGF